MIFDELAKGLHHRIIIEILLSNGDNEAAEAVKAMPSSYAVQMYGDKLDYITFYQSSFKPMVKALNKEAIAELHWIKFTPSKSRYDAPESRKLWAMLDENRPTVLGSTKTALGLLTAFVQDLVVHNLVELDEPQEPDDSMLFDDAMGLTTSAFMRSFESKWYQRSIVVDADFPYGISIYDLHYQLNTALVFTKNLVRSLFEEDRKDFVEKLLSAYTTNDPFYTQSTVEACLDHILDPYFMLTTRMRSLQ
jgi:hypothetical protein